MVDGIMIYLMGKGIKHIIEYHLTKDSFKKVENMEKAIISGTSHNITMDNFMRTKFMGTEDI